MGFTALPAQLPFRSAFALLPFFFPGYSASVPSAFASVSALSRSAPFPSAHPFGLASVSQLSTFRFLAAAFFFHSFELLFSAFRLSSLSGFLTAPASFLSDFPAGLLGFAHPYSLFPSALPFGFASVFGFPLSLPARAFFSFELSALPSFPLFRTSFPACRLSTLSSFLTV